METTLVVHADQRPVWLCFEPWASEYTVPVGTTVVVRFDSSIELTHHPDGIVFMSFGRHPDICRPDGEPLEIFSDTMPPTPSVSVELMRFVMAAVPPVPPSQRPASSPDSNS